jgi:hypothetical protein
MAGLESLDKAVQLGEALAPVLPEETQFEDTWSDEVALGIVLADIDSAVAYEQAKNFITNLETTDDLIRGYVRVRPWPNTDKARSALSMPVILEAIEKIMPALHLSLWGSGKDPFLVSAVGKSKPEAAKAWQSLLRWAIRTSDFKEGSRLTMKNILTYGFGAGVHGWKTEEIKPRKYKKDENGKIVRDLEAKAVNIAKPTYEAANIRNIIFDPACPSQDCRKSRFIAKRIAISAYDLDALRNDDTYKNVPTREELKTILANKEEITKDSMVALKPNQTREMQAQQDIIPASKDPLQSPLELIEYWTQERIVTVLQRCIVIRNEKNDEGMLPVVSCAFIDVLNSLFGFGIGRLLSGEQRFQQGVLNTWVDSLSLILNPIFQQLKSTSGNSNQNISVAPGKVVTVDGELKPLVTPDVSATAQTAIEASSVRAARRVGAEGGSNLPTPAMRTGSGVQAFQGDIIQRFQYFMEQYIDLVFIPVLKAFLVYCSEHLDADHINQILSDEDGKVYEGDPLDIYNADVKIEIISGVKLTTRQAAAQVAPMIIQLLSNVAVQQSLQVQGMKFDYAEFAEEYLELMGWDVNTLFVPMTQDDLMRAQQQNAAAIRNQGDIQLEQEKHKNDLDSIDAKASSQAQLAVLRSNLKVHEQEGMNALDEANGEEQNGTAGQ